MNGRTSSRILQVGDVVPDFRAMSQKGEIRFHELISSKWCLFFAHPADFTPVCTTEFGMVSKLESEFKARNCVILGLSIDSIESHQAWIKDINETQQTEVNFPIIADEDGVVAEKFGMCSFDQITQRRKIASRTLFIIDPFRKVQLQMVYSNNVGRNFYEVVRCLDALQLTTYYENTIGTPANWAAGEDVMILPEVDDNEAKKLFPKGFTSIKPYLRLTPDPEVSLHDDNDV